MTPSYSGRDTGARDILHGEVQLEEHGDCIFYQGSKHKDEIQQDKKYIADGVEKENEPCKLMR